MEFWHQYILNYLEVPLNLLFSQMYMYVSTDEGKMFTDEVTAREVHWS